MSDAPDLFLLHTDLSQALNMLHCLAESACLALEDRVYNDSYTAGLSDLFKIALQRAEDVSSILHSQWAGTEPQAEASTAATMRYRFIIESAEAGYTPAEISQALNLDQEAVLRAINRLTNQAPSDREVKAG